MSSKGIKVKWEPSSSGGTERFEWADLDCRDEQEWNELDDQERAERITNALDGIAGLCFAQSSSLTTY